MATQKQIEYYEDLCEQAYVEPAEDYEDMSTGEMSKAIAELKEIIEGVETELENTDGLPIQETDEEIDEDYMPDEAFKCVYRGGNE